MPLFQDDLGAVSEAAVFAVRWVGEEAYVPLSAHLVPLVRNAFHLRSESVKKKRRRDRLRCTVAELHRRTAKAAAACLSSGVAAELLGRWEKYISGTRSFLEIEGDADLPDLDDLKVCLTRAGLTLMCLTLRCRTLPLQIVTTSRCASHAQASH